MNVLIRRILMLYSNQWQRKHDVMGQRHCLHSEPLGSQCRSIVIYFYDETPLCNWGMPFCEGMNFKGKHFHMLCYNYNASMLANKFTKSKKHPRQTW